jgi:septal ring factor EnvC (AmiA/AmiB activator)
MKFFVYSFLIVFLLPLSARAESMPTPSAHPVKEIEERLEAERNRSLEIEKEMKGLKSSLDDTRTKLVSTAAEVKDNEQLLSSLEKQIKDMDAEQIEIEERLGTDKGAIADLVLALERLRRVPPEAILARPGAPLQTAQSAMILESTLPRIYGRAESLRHDLDRLKVIIAELEDKKAQAVKTSKALEDKQTEMASLLEKREVLYNHTSENQKENAAEIQRISLQANNLKDLVKKLEEREREKERTPQVSARAKLPTAPLPSPGEGQLPVSGIIRISFGQPDDIGAVSQGLTIESRSGGVVVSPLGGVVRYTGTFKNYGQLVIIEHQKGYHSLVAGLDRIDTVVGQSVAAGEPVGTLGTAQNGGKPSVYYELRHKGQPVNPSRFFAELG